MKVIYKKGPCSRKQCCPGGDSHLPVVELRGGAQFVRGGDAVEVPDKEGGKLIDDHPGMFEEVRKTPAKREKVLVPVLKK